MNSSLLRRACGALTIGAALGLGPAAALEWPNMFRWGKQEGAPAPKGLLSYCPEVFAENGVVERRFPPGADAASVRHQISISEMARECTASGASVFIRVGIAGAAVLGPQGAPGAYGADLKIALRRIKDEAILFSKVYRVGAAVPAGASRADFRLVTDTMSLPNVGAKIADEYEILVGFAGGETAAPADGGEGKGKKRRRGRRRS